MDPSSPTDGLLDAKEVVFSHLFRELFNSGDKGVLEVGRGLGEDVGEPGVLQGSNVVCVYPIVDIVQIALERMCGLGDACVCVIHKQIQSELHKNILNSCMAHSQAKCNF